MIKGQMEAGRMREEFMASLEGIYSPGEIRQIFFLLCEKIKGWTRAGLLLGSNELLDEEDVMRFEEALAKLRDFVPVQYIIGTTSFLDLELKVTPDTLIPRPETEELVQHVIDMNRHRQFEKFEILDIGTGSGCIAIALSRFFRGARIWATDISSTALEVAKENATRYGTDIRFLQNDILDESRWNELPAFDFIVSNPPYVTGSEKSAMKRNVMDNEPPVSLFVPDADPLLFYRSIARFSQSHLLIPGQVFVEINSRFGAETRQLFLSHGFDNAEVIDDLNGKRRFVSAEKKFRPLDTSYWHVDH